MTMTLSLRNAGKVLLQGFYSPHRFLWRLPAAQATIALTFDDGPDPIYSPAVLDLLALHGIKATFFLVGEKAEKYPDLVRRLAAEGHSIGGHTWSHREIVGLSRTELNDELIRCRDVVRNITGVDSILFRPPRGRIDMASIHRVCEQGYCLVHWTKTYSDYKRDGTDNLIARFRRNRPVARDIVLLHDHNADTVRALTVLIPEWLVDGTGFAAIHGGS
jgi:peptidoglycan/xylan/chitin deacetylase (PgdA/CDA1 family)